MTDIVFRGWFYTKSYCRVNYSNAPKDYLLANICIQ